MNQRSPKLIAMICLCLSMRFSSADAADNKADKNTTAKSASKSASSAVLKKPIRTTGTVPADEATDSAPTAAGKTLDKKSEPNALDNRSEIKRLDVDLRDFLNRWNIPCVSIAASYNGKLLFARAIGMADWSTKRFAKTKDLFRLASISKSITAIGILRLVQEGKLSLDQKAFDILNEMKPCNPAVPPDPRIKLITIRHLLECSAGWNQDVHGDPMFGTMLSDSANNCSRSLRPTPTSIIRYLLNDRLDFDPGTNYEYSNSCYIILGKIIERVSGMSYYDFISKNVLEPMKLSGIKPGATVERKHLPDEVRYYADSDEKSDSMLPNERGPLSLAYGGYFVLESAPGSIGWVASAEDLVKLVDIVSGSSEIPSLLNAKTTETMFERPKIECWKNASEYFAKGWEVSKDENGNLLYFSRHGSLPGSMALVEHQGNGLSWAALFNFRPRSYIESREQVTQIIRADLGALMPYLQTKYRQ